MCHSLPPFPTHVNHSRIAAPIAWPIAKLLDSVLGASESHTYKKAELKSFLQVRPHIWSFLDLIFPARFLSRTYICDQFHRHGEEPLRDDEISILNGVLELNGKRVLDIMTELKVSFSGQL